MLESGVLYRDSTEQENQILILSRRKSKESSRTAADQEIIRDGEGGTYSKSQRSDKGDDFEKSSMRTADFKKHQNAINLNKLNLAVNFSSKQSSSKTPKFLLSPRTGSLANNTFANSMTAQDEDTYIQ